MPIKIFSLAFLFLCFALQVFAQQTFSLSGVVVDPNNAVIAQAEIDLKGSDSEKKLQTSSEGRFSIDGLAPGNYEIRVNAKGFKNYARKISIPLQNPLQITLEIGSITDTEGLTVSRATEPEVLMTRQATVITTFTPRQIQQAAAQTVDDLLRQVPGFSNFRRSSSLVANPTTQGVSLRGAGASGASRTVVIADGLPLNDAFGGWVYWDRIPREAIASIDVERGGASHLYGSDALSGVINLSSRFARTPTISASTSYGNLSTGDVSFFAGDKFKDLILAGYGEGFRTDGYYIIAPEIRGAADHAAASKHRTLGIRAAYEPNSNFSFNVRGSVYDQDRNNGTQLQLNDTAMQSMAAGANFLLPDKSNISLSLYGNKELYHQIFTAVATNRATETVSRQQATPSRDAGARLNWSKATQSIHTFFAGAEIRGVRGTSDETVFANNRATTFVSAGGRQRRLGFFAQDYLTLNSRWMVVISGRYDQWRDSAAASVSRSLSTGLITPTFFQPRTEDAFSPRLAVIYHPKSDVELRASAYRAFRAPTLNELYRSFRVGDTLTNANENLHAEHLTGGEAGISWMIRRRVTTRLTGYYTEIVNPISNFTISTTPTLITRQRRNLGRTRSSGIEAEVDLKVTERLRFSSGYLFADAIVKRAPQDVTLQGLQIPQVPRHQITMQLSYFNPGLINAALQFRATGRQFDDDQNRLPLNAYALIDTNFSRNFGKYFEAFFAVQNLLDKKFSVGRTPLETLGMPRMVRGGIRVKLER